ncbi:hypothetical protein [Frigoriflavimonas asaccharolytica]|uniref:Uncharacterized protein n=1 Tax=Frigoriflavimonas asaccharolytica TaxID=2735899 RepID=A0A8J8KCS7_9FLAO|nr:hypothetical protein [Frigoriflavimonas asaccharolytica]NRS93979.1 hypothetical protein [Frigoriflavimonas asaccharolytica]
MEIHLKIIGVLLILLSLVHFDLPKRFDWKNNLAGLNLFNRQMFKVHVVFIMMMEILLGILFFTSSVELVNTNLGKKICLGLGFFWGLRAVFQFFVYSPKLWRGKTFETIIHILFSILWFYLTIIFFVIAFQ